MLKELNTLKKQNKDLATLIVNYNDKVASLEGANVELEKEVRNLRHLKTENVSLHTQIIGLKKIISDSGDEIKRLNEQLHDADDIRVQKHPMYPIHWGGYSYDEQEVKQPEFKISDKLKKLFRKDYQTAEAKSSPETPETKALLDKLTGKTQYVSWEEAAANLALRVVKLEQELKYSPKIKFTPTDNTNNAPY